MSPLLPGKPSTPFQPQCQGTPIWWTFLPSIVKGLSRLVTIAVTWTFPRGLEIVIFSPLSMLSSPSSGQPEVAVAWLALPKFAKQPKV